MSLSQFWPYLQELGAKSTPNRQQQTGDWTQAGVGNVPPSPSLSQASSISSQHWALVDEQGKFLGLLNSWLLLKFLTQNVTATDAPCVSEQPQPSTLTQLVQLLEQLPLPLSLQTATGQVLAENVTWRQQLGTSPNLNWVRRTTAAMLDSLSIEPCSVLRTDGAITEDSSTVPENSTTFHPEALAQQSERSVSVSTANKGSMASASEELAGRSSVKLSTRVESPVATNPITKQHGEFSPQACVQRYCAMDTPCMAATVSQRQAILSAPPISKNHETSAFGKAVASAVETGKQNQERIFSFVKIPLLPSVVRERNRDGDGERGKGANHIPFSPTCYAQATPTPYHSITEATSLPNPLTSNLWLVLAQDTTEQQKATKELAAKNADLIQLNRLKDEFLACISHELKTPLTAVLGLSTLLKDQTLGQLNERQARYARLIYQSGRQLMTVVNDILDLTRMETGQLELMLEPVDIQSVCDRAYAQVRQLHCEKEQEEEITPETQFTLEIEPDLDRLVGDELRLRQMLVHLLSNALKFTNPGGKIGLRVNRWEGWIAFTVWDTGIGIPPEKQHLIFQKFQQLEQPLTRRHEGTGLGLVLTQHLARLHGGDVSFISKLGEGSQFTILLPPCPPQGRKQELNVQEGLQVDRLNGESSNLSFGNGFAEQHSTQPSRNRLVLVVETVPRYLERLTEQLKNLAYRVVVARSGTEAIEKARTLQPYAILLNPLLPKLSGWDVLT
ncbi:MAG: hybrid sensor histidine kinase/response regulator, partial [Coleofasciculus sp. Co-bin14]|nr:hybrid sensor histidine kinase/response regulator [Coleofasciculus sp. Co-bin14]